MDEQSRPELAGAAATEPKLAHAGAVVAGSLVWRQDIQTWGHFMTGIAYLVRAGLTAALLAVTAHAQTPPPSGPLDAAARKTAVDKAAELLRTRYIFPEAGEAAARKIEAELAAGSYDALAEPWPFAQRLTADLQSVTHDRHMRVSPPGPPPGAGPNAAPPPAPVRSEAGVVRADKLPGNIGYIEISGFPPLEQFKRVVDRAMPALKDTRALIIDIRRNGGGSPDAVAYLVSHFVDPKKPMLLNTFINRKPGTSEFTRREEMTVATPMSYLGKPVYVLTSQRTFSGGEEFAYDMQTFKLATLVGETTGGGANPGGMAPIGPRFGLFVPNGRPENAITRTNWEGVGVKPEAPTAAEDALKVALEKLGQKPASGDIDRLSEAKLFSPRSTPQPGTEAVAREAMVSLARGVPDYDRMAPELAEATRQQLPGIQKMLTDLGELQAVTFREVGPNGMDAYDIKFANGSLIYRLALDDQGKVVGALISRPQ